MRIAEQVGHVGSLLKILRTLRQLRAHDSWSREKLHRHQQKTLSALRTFAYQNSPFYQKFHKDLTDVPFEELPVLTKGVMMEHFDEFLTDRSVQLEDLREHIAGGSIGMFHGKYHVITTSGSTGNPGIFLYDAAEWTRMIAAFAKAREWAGMNVDITKRSKMAVVSSTNDRNLSARIGRSVDTPFIPTIRIDATEKIESIVQKLNNFQPEVVVAYASMAYFLAIQQNTGQLHIHPKKIFTSSEVVTSHMRMVMEKAFGNVIFNEYAATEAGSIAAEDEAHHGMHVFEDMLIVENVDAENKPVTDGKFGDKLLITTLFNRTQPLIRYEISDSVRFAKQNPSCHLPYQVIDGVRGRQEDILTIHGVQIHPNVFHDIFDAIPNKGWQVVQEKKQLKILLVEPETDTKEIEKTVSEELTAKGASIPVLTEVVDTIPKGASGKSPLIKALR